ncbi:hypothetical protein PHIM7_226 [Sinorhizobium phage phiM7]|uniref:Uncharacterized protein n=3 Tax=Emdodecavirus TaxID=1980937 RepID=S5MVK8_9CAUD|nr:hypothetical protein AB690_gp280 [Sinorhizobium phage phiM12]YP_009212477.1 hypothetical protein AVT40_gp296 [Sinorhizobium phage phiN3]YP_009601351.1 hypothetical protein FDH46_gp252 [Sinorhizobium phage phiM7]AKF13132.1 hypothetical protein PHIM19_227 [Sinorhizobium phage phiM19]AGR47932.1 hypothetical protein SmphiM12_300 [Sinorhizobium phage phiM12]AKF12771.1 hypothetical protein PHIM7_226 [Sinorhizobium phage phiM7]AKF13500.1 hypothetical protein PHIN3_237 [Sinorhizobium phage phiN3]
MTIKLESIVTWVPFGYGMIARKLSDDPTTEEDPIVVFTHKMAVGGKYHNGEPILSQKEERKMFKEVDALIATLNENFTHNNDFVKVGSAYNQPRKPRKPRQTEVANENVEDEKHPEIVEHHETPDNLKDVTPPKKVASTKRVALSPPQMTKEELTREKRIAGLVKARAARLAKLAAAKAPEPVKQEEQMTTRRRGGRRKSEAITEAKVERRTRRMKKVEEDPKRAKMLENLAKARAARALKRAGVK